MELRPLAYFNATCQQSSLVRAAAVLGLAPSTLSASLKGLEEQVGLPLFRRTGPGLYPAAAALWLYRTSLPLLHAEAMVRRFATGTNLPLLRLRLEIRLSFTIGRITKAVSAAIEALGAAMPNLLVEPVWRMPGDAAAREEEPADLNLLITYDDGPYEDWQEDGPAESLVEDSFVLARAMPAGLGAPPLAADLLRGPVVVPALPVPLLDLASSFLRDRAADASFSEEEAGALPRLAAERPDAAFLVPRSLLADRLGLPGFRAVPLEDAPRIAIVARGSDAGPVTQRLVAALRAGLAGPDSNTVFRPTLTLRQFQTFETLVRVRRVTAAARSLGVTQPAVTEQLLKMERALGEPLFARQRDGLVPTPTAERLRIAAAPLGRLQQALGAGRAAAPGDRGGRLTLGLPPAAGPDDGLHTRLATAIARWRAAHAAIRLRILDAPTATLQAWIQEGALDLALVESAPPSMARFNLEATEPLVLVCAPEHRDGLPSMLTLEALFRLPLVLPGAADATRRTLDEAARQTGLALRPAVEVSSLSLALALVRTAELYTVAAPSAVTREVAEGRLACVPIENGVLMRPLFVVYHGERPLTPAERALVQAMREALRGGSPDAGSA
jgi:DNA-binding transcriptional LysR family regulator